MKELTSSAAQCPGDHVSLYDGVDEYSELIGRWCGVGSFPVSIIGSSNKLFLEFVSTKHGPLLNTGQLLVASIVEALTLDGGMTRIIAMP